MYKPLDLPGQLFALLVINGALHVLKFKFHILGLQDTGAVQRSTV